MLLADKRMAQEQWHKRAITCPVYVAIEPPVQVGII